MRFSILISVYNTEPFLRACLDSVLAQTFSDYEVVLVDDGSEDESGRICDSYAEKDRRVRVFHTENRGVFLARAFAESHARGDYLLHFDADDLVEPALLACLSAKIDEHAPDLLLFDFSTFRADAPPVRESFWDSDRLLQGDDFAQMYRLVFSTRFNTLCNKCFHRKLIEAAPDYDSFPGLRHGEDLLRSACLVFAAERVYYIHRSFYRYRLGVGHACRFDPDSLWLYDRILRVLRTQLSEKVPLSPDWENEIGEMCRKQLDNYLRLLASSGLSLSQGNALLHKASETELFHRALSAAPNDTKYRLLRKGRYRTLLILHRGKRWLYAQ